VPSLSAPRSIVDCSLMAISGPGSATRAWASSKCSARMIIGVAMSAAHAWASMYKRPVGSCGRRARSESATSSTSTWISPIAVDTTAPLGPLGLPVPAIRSSSCGCCVSPCRSTMSRSVVARCAVLSRQTTARPPMTVGRAKQLNRSAHHAFIGDIEVWLLINAKRDWRPVCSGGAGVRS